MFNLDHEAFRNMFREIIAEEVAGALQDFRTTQLPPMLTKQEFMEVMKIKETMASQLINRADFPVFKEAGLRIPTHLLFKWIEENTDWVAENTDYYKKGATA